MIFGTLRQCFVATILVLFAFMSSNAATVPVHDPSIVVVYKDASGNSYPANDAAATRTKYYYVFGTMLGAAYSTDMLNWTSFTPTMSLNGAVSTDYYNIFKAEADYAGHSTTDLVLGNLWAPDVIYNTSMKKWCIYFSLSGNDFKSSIIMLTSSKVDGPYVKAGDVVFGGYTNAATSIARTDYAKVTGSSTVAARYLTSGAWNNDYSVSCIDPAVTYDQSGQLWIVYGSWSGGIFLLKLDASTGLRDYSTTYSVTWDGTRLRSDPYFGKHIGGGWYVSGEGPYIEYMKDASGVGYYYLFVSMGFYSPEGGYTMRVFRSSTIGGTYTDVTGDDAVFSKYIFNYGSNVQYGFPIMQNFKWSWWATGTGQVAQGHNSVLQDDDGNAYLIYHRKFDNGTAWHNVEVHQLFFNERGWVVASPFEYRKGFGLTTKTYTAEDIAGSYGVITHNSVDYASLATNTEARLYVNADGTLTGAYTGTWAYNYANGRQYLTLVTTAGTFQCVVCQQLTDGLSSQTIGFTGMNAANERALWGYRYTSTATTSTTVYTNQARVVGKPDYSLAWDSYSDFCNVAATGDFEVEYTFANYTQAAENWHNWAIALTGNSQTWHMRADAYSVSTFTGSTVNYKYNWDWANFKDVYKNKDVRVKISRIGTSINVFAEVEGTIVYTATAINCPTTDLTVYLGGESCYLDVKKVSVSKLGTRQLVGTANDDGTYTAAFNSLLGTTTSVTGNFQLKYYYYNYHNTVSNDNWDNFILRILSGTQTTLLRADAFAMDVVGSNTYTYDWDLAKFLSVMSGAYIELSISRVGTTITYSFVIEAKDGNTYNYKVVNTGAPTTAMSFGFTCEESLVDLLEAEVTTAVAGTNVSPAVSITSPLSNASLYAQASIPVQISATDNDGTISRVELYNGSTLLATLTSASYTYNLANAAIGIYTLTAKATDNSGAVTTSTTVTFQVVQRPITYVYNNASTDLWTTTANWTPAALPTNIDTAVIRTGEVKMDSDFGGVVKVEPAGIFRLTDSISVTDLRLQGGTLKSYTSTPVFILTTTLAAEQASTVMVGSVSTSLLYLNGTLTGSGNLTKTSVGTLRVNASAASYTGTWIVKEGRLQVRNATGLGLCGVEVDSAANLDVETTASTNSIVIKPYGTVNLDANLTVQAAVFGDLNIPAGTYTAASYPSFITGTGTLTVAKGIVTVGLPSAGSITLTANSGSSYLWSNGASSVATTAAYSPTATGTYTVKASTAAGCSTTSAPVYTQLVSLTRGWNLISVNLVPDSLIDNVCGGDARFCVSTLFAGLNVLEIKTMDGFWRSGQIAAFNSITSMIPGNGYLVNMNTAGKLMVAGNLNLRGFGNLGGLGSWQLIGCPFQTPTPISTYFNSLNYSEIKSFEGFYIPGGSMNSIQNFEPGKGYFLKR